MYAAGGTFLIFFVEKKQNRLYLEPWDAIQVPGNVALEEIPGS
jgi:hypothetical protein